MNGLVDECPYLLKRSLIKPHSVNDAAEEPEPAGLGGFDAVVVAPRAATTPPTGFDSLGPPKAHDAMLAIVKSERDRRTVGHDRRHIQPLRLRQVQRPIE